MKSKYIEVSGKYFSLYKIGEVKSGKDSDGSIFTIEEAIVQATKCIADMLRYDNGEVITMMPFKSSQTSTNHNFMAIVKCPYYTKARWDSFGLMTKQLSEAKAMASIL
jgi:hypothetical protein